MGRINYDHLKSFIESLPIESPDGRIVRFIMRPGQARFIELLKTLDAERRPPRVIIVKSRRVGISRICSGVLVAHCIWLEHARARITAHLTETAQELFSGTKLMHAALKLNAPEPTRHVIRFGPSALSARMTIGTAKTVAGGRGMGFTALLQTEAAHYEKEESFVSILPTLTQLGSEYPAFIESTANGRDGVGEPFADAWDDAERGSSDLTPFFLGPQEDPTCVVNEELAKRIMARPTDDENGKEEKELAARFSLNILQLAWRRMKYLSAECRGRLTILHQEYPYWAAQSFISSGSPCFEPDELRYARECVEAAGPPVKGNLKADPADGRHRTVTFEDRSGPFLIWEKPKPDHYYYVGADCARGDMSGDFSAACVIDGSSGKQVAAYMEKAGVDDFADHLDRLGHYFGRHMSASQAMMNIEVTGGYGHTVQQRMRDHYGYSNFYRWKGKDEKHGLNTPKRPALGWITNMTSREVMMTHFRMALQEHSLQIADHELLRQMEIATQKLGQRWEIRHMHDDAAMAALICWMAVVQWPPPRIISGGRVAGGPEANGQQEKQIAQLPGQKSIDDVRNISPMLEMHRARVINDKQDATPKWAKHVEERVRL